MLSVLTRASDLRLSYIEVDVQRVIDDAEARAEMYASVAERSSSPVALVTASSAAR